MPCEDTDLAYCETFVQPQESFVFHGLVNSIQRVPVKAFRALELKSGFDDIDRVWSFVI